MVWAAVGVSGVIGPFFIKENVSGETYLILLTEKFLPAFSSYPNASVTPLQAGRGPTSLVPACEGLAQSELC